MIAIEGLRNLRIKAGRQIKEKLPAVALTGMLAFTTAGGIGCSESTDRIPPVITILGENPISVERGTTYIDPGATARDKVGGIFNVKIRVRADGLPVKTGDVGAETIIYTATDRAGNVSTAIRTVNVVPPSDKTTPNR